MHGLRRRKVQNLQEDLLEAVGVRGESHPHSGHPSSSHTSGVTERWFESLKYEGLYRYDIDSADDLATRVETFLGEYNRIRPHENITGNDPTTDT